MGRDTYVHVCGFDGWEDGQWESAADVALWVSEPESALEARTCVLRLEGRSRMSKARTDPELEHLVIYKERADFLYQCFQLSTLPNVEIYAAPA